MGKSIVLFLPHVLEENFFLFFILWLLFLPSLFIIMLLCINSLNASCSATWSLTLYIFLIPLFLTYPDHLLLHSLDSLLSSAFHHTLLHLLQLLLFIFHGQVHFHILLTPEAWVHTWLCMPFTPGSLGLFGRTPCLMVYWAAISPESSPSVVTEACTWNSLRLWLTEGPRERLEGSYICSDCIYPAASSNATFFILVCWAWHYRQRVLINVPNIS